jgi:hypothetical protein
MMNEEMERLKAKGLSEIHVNHHTLRPMVTQLTHW